MVVEPRRLHAFWEIDDDDVASLKKRLGGVLVFKNVLRVYNITNMQFNGANERYFFDMEIGPGEEKLYIDLWTSGGEYCVEVGIKTKEGDFFPLARSNSVSAPKTEPARFSEPKWMKVEMPNGKFNVYEDNDLKENEKPVIDTRGENPLFKVLSQSAGAGPRPNSSSFSLTFNK